MKFRAAAMVMTTTVIAATIVTGISTPASAGVTTCWLNGKKSCETSSIPPSKLGYVTAKLRVGGFWGRNLTGTIIDTVNNVSVGSFTCKDAGATCSKEISGLTNSYKLRVTCSWFNGCEGWGSIQN